MIRLILLLLIVGGLTLFALQNWSPMLPIVFLGIKTVSLPLAMWILFAIAAGLVTSWLMGALLQLSNYLSEKELRSRIRQLEARKSRPAAQSRVDEESTSSAADDDDFFEDEFFEEEEERKEPTYKTPNYQDYTSSSTAYERPQEPKTQSQSGGSVYSFGYRDKGDTGVGKTESIYSKTDSVYDADYRVIKPPSRNLDDIEPTDRKQDEFVDDWERKSDDDDWGFDDDEFDPPKSKR